MIGNKVMTKEVSTPQEMKAIRVRHELIGKWGADTISLFKQNVKVPKLSDYLCLTALTVCSAYSNAVMVLLRV
jgi:hypothetical protein